MKALFQCLIFLFPLVSMGQEWRELFTESQTQFSNEQWEEAALTAQKAIDNYTETSGEVNGNYAALLRLGVTTNFEIGNFEKSAEFSSREKKVLEAMGETSDSRYGFTLFNLGYSYFMLDDYDKSLPAFQGALENFNNTGGEPTDIINLKWKIGSTNYFMGNSDEALKWFSEGFNDFGDPEDITMDYIQAAFDYSGLLIDLGKYSDTKVYLDNLIGIKTLC